MRHPDDRAIGGYFGLPPEAVDAAAPPWPGSAHRFQSARSAMASVLQASGARRAWVPHFICGVVDDALAWAGVQAQPYPLGSDYGVPDGLAIGESDWVLCVDYFGQSAGACDRAIARFGAHRVLVDASQALFHAAKPGATTVYSPRKFAGLPDGGLLVTPHDIAPPLPADEAASAHRRRHLVSRAGGDVATGYRQFQEAEASLNDCTPRAMSAATARAAAGIDWAGIAVRRRNNYSGLADALGAAGIAVPALAPDAVPLCCLVPCPDAVALRPKLASEGVFTAMYWPDARVPDSDPVGLALREQTLYLPCDQRYDLADMLGLATALLRLWGKR